MSTIFAVALILFIIYMIIKAHPRDDNNDLYGG